MRLLIHDYAGHPFPVQLSRELARRGHAVVHAFAGGLLTPRGNLQRKPDEPENLEFCEVPMDPNYRRDKYRFLKRRRMEVEYKRKIAALIHKRKPDAVISGQTPTEPQLRIANKCSRLGILFVPWIQDFYSVAVAKLAKKKLPVIGNVIGWWYRHLERKTLRQAAAAIAITEDFVPMLRQSGVPQAKIVVIPNWAPLDELPLRLRSNPWAAAQGLINRFVFLYSGTLAMKHNPDTLRRLAVAFKEDSSVRVVVVSEGPGADYLQERRSAEGLEHLQIFPFQSFSEMPDVLGTADVLLAILEADAGTFSVPSKVLTYHCAGRPILAAMPSANLASRIISEAGSGFCVEPRDIHGFVEAAWKLRREAVLREQMGSRARFYAAQNFDIKDVASRFEALIKRIAA